MIYIRKLFKQDLRDGKQIAFPKEPSSLFFSFEYKTADIKERKIVFIYDCLEERTKAYDKTTIDTRIYSAASESRIDGQLKAFLRDRLLVQIDDLVVFRKVGKSIDKFIFSIIRKGDLDYEPYCSLMETDNHSIMYFERYDMPPIAKPTSVKTSLIPAIRTKPFLLLAGISGTGKSRIVRELAFKSCPKNLQDEDGTTPGNYCMIEVKPNWHDSTELLGYYSNMNGEYQFTKFVKFLVKAKMYPDVPFFVCLDEMNLAPVEQYFAEVLSVLETRRHPKGNMDVIKTGVLVDAEHFKRLGSRKETYPSARTNRDAYEKLFGLIDTDVEDKESRDLLDIGLTLPDNVVIIGTVNMDDTTHQFSRKVIDRAMTIEMNGGRLADMFGGSNDLEYLDDEQQQKWQKAFKQRYVTANEVLMAHPECADEIKEKLPAQLEAINAALKGTPFEVSYRVLNELTIMVGVMMDYAEGKSLDEIIPMAVNNILLMKILPRIEGDADMFNLAERPAGGFSNRLEWLKSVAPDIAPAETDGEENAEASAEPRPQSAREKIQEMIERLENQEFTRFWP